MKYIRGKPLEPGEKRAIVSVKGYFDRNKKEFGLIESSVQLTADALEVGVSTVKRVMADYRRDPLLLDKPPEPRGHPNYAIDCSHIDTVRSFIRNANQNGQYITISSISEWMKDKEPNIRFHPGTTARTLDRWGFEFGKGKRSQHLFETDEIIALRQKYLRRIRANRDSRRSEIYLDESYVNKNHSNDFIWYSELIFQANQKTGDYHGQMNAELFQKWFCEKLIPNIPDNSLIIMDNAPYHNTLSSCSPPTPSCTKEKIWNWLLSNQIPVEKNSLKAELVTVLKKIAPLPVYEIDEIAKKYGHD